MKAEIIAIGTELLMGQTVDTNSSWLASQLPELGIDLYSMSQIGDNVPRIVEALGRAMNRSDLVLTTGGLGPTEDDVTREAVAELVGETMYVDPDLKANLDRWFQRRGSQMAGRNIKQAMLVESAVALSNNRGTAPGWWAEKGGLTIISMPGPPREMRSMWEGEIVAKLRGRLKGEAIVSRLLKTFGIPEATVDEMLGEHLHNANPTIGVYSKMDGIHIRLTAKAASENKAWALLAPLESAVRQIVGESLWGTDGDTLEGIIGGLLVERGLTLAVMEAPTGGLLSSTITDVSGSSEYFRGGLVACDGESKVSHGVSIDLIERFGEGSTEVAGEMARVAMSVLGADVGIGITGSNAVEDRDGLTMDTVEFAIRHRDSEITFASSYPQGRLNLKHRAASATLFELRKFLSSLPGN